MWAIQSYGRASGLTFTMRQRFETKELAEKMLKRIKTAINSMWLDRTIIEIEDEGNAG